MPSFPRHVAFDPNESVSRPASQDELQAVYNYARHASHCDRCADPYRVHLAGKTLCDRGHHYARHVAKHLYLQRGRPCSTVDGHDYRYVEVEIPVGCDVVRGLLKAVEHGLRLRRSKQSPSAAAIVSHDRTYLVQPRRAETVRAKESRPKDSRSRVEIVEPPRGGYHDTKVVYLNRDGSPYRPSLLGAEGDYEADDSRIVYASPRSTSYRHGQEELYR